MCVSKQLNLSFTIIMVSFVIIVLPFYHEDMLGTLLAPWTRLTTRVTLALIHCIGMEAVRNATIISHPDGFAYEIYYRCTSFLPVAFLCVSILAYQRPLHYKFIGLIVGVPILMLINLVRLVHLFYIGVNNPSVFRIVHSVIWLIIMIIVILSLWVIWIKWTDSAC